MDKASQALALDLPPGVPDTYAARAEHGKVALTTLHHRARGRRSIEEKAQSQQYLTPWEEKAVVKFVLQMEDLGQPVRIKYLPSLAFSVARQRPTTDKATKLPGKNWAQAFQKRHPELIARRFRALDWNRYNIYDKIKHWFDVIGEQLRKPDIVPENIYNMDETGVMLPMLTSVKVLVSKDDQRRYRGARVKRITVTAIECVSADGRCLNPMIIWPASTHRAHWTTHPTPGWHYACSESGYTNSKISLEWLKRVFDPQTKQRANKKPRMLIWDGFGTHETLEILEFCFENNIILCRIPSHTSHKLQPCDVAVFDLLKTAYRDQVERLKRGGVGTIVKEHFTYLYSPARIIALTPRNIKQGFKASGLFPLNPDRVLIDVPKPPQELTVPNADEVKAGSCRQDKALEPPMTPLTPMTAEAITSLRSLIKQDADALDETSKKALTRHVEKLTNAVRISFADRALLRDRARFLTKINNEAKVRRATKAEILGRAKVMSYEDLEKSRAERDAKEKAKAKGKGKRSRKPKSSAPEAEESIAVREKCGQKRKNAASEVDLPEPKIKVARMCEGAESSGTPVARKNEAQIVEDGLAAPEGGATS